MKVDPFGLRHKTTIISKNVLSFFTWNKPISPRGILLFETKANSKNDCSGIFRANKSFNVGDYNIVGIQILDAQILKRLDYQTFNCLVFICPLGPEYKTKSPEGSTVAHKYVICFRIWAG